MAKPPATYDLVLLLDPQAEDDRRQKILSDVRAMVAAGGEIVNEQDWGTRPMAYEIRHKADAEYHLLQFHPSRELLGEPRAHAAHHRRRRALPHHQARARAPPSRPSRRGPTARPSETADAAA